MCHAQWQSNTGPSGAALGAVVGGDVERYVRALAMAGLVKPVAWGARPFGADELSELLRDTSAGAHPWKTAMQKALAPRASLGGMVFTSVNTGFPWGANDGAMWQGRGVTSAAGGAATFRWGPLSGVLAPVLYIAQNASFPLMPSTESGGSPYAEPLYPGVVDFPQRMGDAARARLDAGESSIRIAGSGMVGGISTASQGWGTGESFPAILGANAGGFPHLFVGTRARGLRIPFVGRVSGTYVLGTLGQSAWSPVQGSETFIDRAQPGTTRTAVGLSVSFMPAALDHLELGLSRFYHSPYLSGGNRWDAWSKPFEGILKKGFGSRSTGAGDLGGGNDNQLAAFFARWSFPARGVEATFEYLRDDYSWDSRDFAQEPDNNGAVMASIRVTTERTATHLAALTFEFFDGDVSPIAQVRQQNFLYANTIMRQGHTLNGQLLGTPIGVGAMTGQRVAWERFDPRGSWRVNVQRWRTRSLGSTDPELLFRPPAAPLPNNHDWIMDGSLARARVHGSSTATIEAGIAWAGTWQLSASRTNMYARASWSLF